MVKLGGISLERNHMQPVGLLQGLDGCREGGIGADCDGCMGDGAGAVQGGGGANMPGRLASSS